MGGSGGLEDANFAIKKISQVVAGCDIFFYEILCSRKCPNLPFLFLLQCLQLCLGLCNQSPEFGLSLLFLAGLQLCLVYPESGFPSQFALLLVVLTHVVAVVLLVLFCIRTLTGSDTCFGVCISFETCACVLYGSFVDLFFVRFIVSLDAYLLSFLDFWSLSVFLLSFLDVWSLSVFLLILLSVWSWWWSCAILSINPSLLSFACINLITVGVVVSA